MNTLNSCRVCLEAQEPMYNILDSPLHGIFEKLTDMKVDLSGRSHVLCLLCHSHLKKSYRLIQRARKTEEYLLSLISNDTETIKDIKLDIGHSLCVSKTEISSINECNFKNETELLKPYQIKVECSDESTTCTNTNKGCILENEPTETEVITHHQIKVEFSPETATTCTNIYDDMTNFDSLEVTNEEINLSVDAQAPKKDKTDINNFSVTRNDTKEKLYTCSYCHHVFTTEHYLTKHLRKHTGAKPFGCSICDRKFTTKSNLTTHFKTHTGEKPYACCYCDRRFTNKSHLAGHLRTHTGEKPYECSDCDRRFKTKSELTAHSRTHTGEKPYACSRCDRKFRNKSHVIEHLRTHKREKPYQCSDCNRKFMTKNNLTLHFKRHTREKKMLEAK